MKKNSVLQFRNYSKDLNDSNKVRINLETGPEALLDCYRKLYRHQIGACRGGSTAQKLQKIFSISGT